MGCDADKWYAYAAVHGSSGVREIVFLDPARFVALGEHLGDGRLAVAVVAPGVDGGEVVVAPTGEGEVSTAVIDSGGGRAEAVYLASGVVHMVGNLVERMSEAP